MKKRILLIIMLQFCFSYFFGQTASVNSENNINKGFQISLRGGFDAIPVYNNNTPYIDYDGNWMAGGSADYYFNRWWGIGVDFDYLVNNPKSIYPTSSLYYSGFPVNQFHLKENYISRTFLGIGPDFRYKKNDRWNLELKLRGGISNIKGGYTMLEGTVPIVPTPMNIALNHHAGYDAKNVFSGKASFQYNYFISKSLGLHLGIYHINHFKVEELVDPATGYASSYYDFKTNQDGGNDLNLDPTYRNKACNCNINSTGVYAGLTFRFPQKEKCTTCQMCPVCKKVHEPPMCVAACTVCGCKISITAKDKISGELLNETDVVLQRSDGTIVESGKTNSFGVVVFDNVQAGDYSVKGKLHNVNLQEAKISQADFDQCKANGGVIQKQILYTDDNFVLKGQIFECNTTKTIEGANIELLHAASNTKKNTISSSTGEYIFNVNKNTVYSIKGNKDGYFSNEMEINTATYDRSKSLFIRFEVCVDPCGKAIRLNNINFNLDKSDILPASEPDLNYVVTLMKKNPKIKVELSSHTDWRGSHAYNQKLSQRRADSSVNYIVNKGIDRSRLVSRGAGETELLNRCADNVECTEEENRINRRTEFKILCVENY
ncbi:OmpA family protein [Chryseobacterium caseinilyticum]|uniref:OmpA family protein n=1 Tax=Chryseobacterium caseinilyticum TaxID=2771428 RepID=A0ABR8ZF27_9FLAO|nr:OmpA family protein [Chryseobacterium caseinilyticum]MBD8083900.1 OmpA family protein [Chryseobacterium caseinilyticum]